MFKLALRVSLSIASIVLTASVACAAGKHGEIAPDFPPGQFNDGQRYQLSDFEGKVTVLFFYEKDCPRCRGSIPERNAVVQQYKGKPVRFLAIAAGDTLQQAKSYAGGTKLAMPVYADPLSLMEKRYGLTMSLQNIWQVRVIGPDGKVTGYKMDAAEIDEALQDVKLKYNPEDYHEKVRPVAAQFEWNQHAAGMRSLKLLLKHKDAEIVESAKKLESAVQEEGKTWIAEAETAKSDDPVRAYDLYTKTVAAFGADDLGKKAAEGVKPLKTDAKVKAELEARKMFDKVVNVMSVATPQNKTNVVKFTADLVKKYPDTPTGKKAEELQKEIGS